MEFKSLKNIETSFQQIRFVAIIFLVMCSVASGYAVWKSYDFAERQREKIYVLDEGRSLMLALSQDLSQNRPVEAREHIRRFHELFFTLSPDKAAIESNIDRALTLIDRTGYNIYVDLLEKGYYNRIISGGINQKIEIKEIECDMNQYPYKVTCRAVQSIIRESNITERSLVTTCDLINSVRSDNNPQGFTIERFEVVENEDLRVTKR